MKGRSTSQTDAGGTGARSGLDLRFLLHFRSRILAVIAAGIAASVLEALGVSLFIPVLQGVSGASSVPFPLSRVADAFKNLNVGQRLRVVSVLLIAVYGLKGFVVYLNAILSAKLEADGTNYQIIRCYKRILGARMGYMNGQPGSYVYSLLRQLVGHFGNILRAVGEAVVPVFTSVVLLVLLILVSWQMTLLASAFAAVASLAVQLLQRRALAGGRAIARSVSRLDATVLDTIHGLKTIHLFVRGGDMVTRFTGDIEDWAARLVGMARIQSATGPVFELTSIAGLSLLLILGSFLLSASGGRTFQFDVLVTFLIIFYRMLPTVAALNRARVSIASMIPACHEVQAFMDQLDVHQVESGGRIWQGLQRRIEFRNLSFRYEADRETVLTDVSITVPRGTKLGIVGSSGAGKSTVGELLLHFYDPDEGAILADGVDLRDIELASWRRRIGVVTQETFLFNDTIGGNIRFSKPDAGPAEVERAARRAHIHEFIAQLPLGYDTMVGDRGVLLSGGQRQRLAIARAILPEPEILLLDEATSALDSESEQIVQRAIDEISQGRTVIAIAHRLSTVANSDTIVVLHGGRVVEQGTHAELLARPRGTYRRLAEMQSMIGDSEPAITVSISAGRDA